MQLSENAIEALAATITGRCLSSSSSRRIRRRRFLSVFGISPYVVSLIWDMFENGSDFADTKIRPIHLLWTLYFLKVYDTETVCANACCCDEKTFRKWIWVCMEQLAELEDDVVSHNKMNETVCPYLQLPSWCGVIGARGDGGGALNAMAFWYTTMILMLNSCSFFPINIRSSGKIDGCVIMAAVALSQLTVPIFRSWNQSLLTENGFHTK